MAYTISRTYRDGELRMYTTYPLRPPSRDGRTQVVMAQLDSWSLTGNAGALRRGVAASWNGRDWAKQQRDQAITLANEKVAERGIAAPLPSNVLGLSLATEASASIDANSQC